MEIIYDPAEMQKRALTARREGHRIAFVPTMGFFHEGHISLMRKGRALGDLLVVSNFVNPMQFGPAEDLDAYPRDFERDCTMAREAGVDIMFAPRRDSMYPRGFRTFVEVGEWGTRLCGMTRPTHFRGVTTIVAKLFNIVQPDAVIMGWKDAQQFLILRRMVEDLNMPIEMIGVETMREADGLAMSSRNRYLTAGERAEAPAIYRSLCEARSMIEKGERRADVIMKHIQKTMAGLQHGRIDYSEAVSMSSIEPLSEIQPGDTLIATAVFFGKARLIDNIRC